LTTVLRLSESAFRRIDLRRRRCDFAALLHPSKARLAALTTAMACLCYAFLHVNYGLHSFGDAYFAFARLPEPIMALDRVIATATGGTIGLIAQFAALHLASAQPASQYSRNCRRFQRRGPRRSL
jgi:hypothetical protein